MSTNLPSAASNEPHALTIIIIDPRALIRDCLASSLRMMNENFVVLTFASTDEWCAAKRDYSSAVIVICDRLSDSIEHDLAQIAEADATLPAVIISDAEGIERIRAAFAAGARGYIPTSVPLNVAVEAMRLVDAGGTFVPTKVLEQGNGMAFKPAHSLFDHFTARQAAVLERLKQGKANKRIAHELNMREGTVKVHVRNIMRKLKAKNRTEVALWISTHLTNGSDLQREGAGASERYYDLIPAPARKHQRVQAGSLIPD